MKSNDITSTRRRQISATLVGLRMNIPQMPKKGWISEVRSALMLSTKQLANRLKLTQSTISHLEAAERNGSITLSSLQKLAEAMNCEVAYVFIPIIPLDEQVDMQAEKAISKMEKELHHTMALEDQSIEDKESVRNILKREMLVQNLGSKIWDS